MAEKFLIFISSPGDVADERRRAALVIKRLNREFARFFDLQAVLWEREAMRASGHFQDVIVPPSATDVVVVILCARLGVPLPERTAVRQYCGLDGRTPVTGTEWEFEDALRANREGGFPELLVYRKPASAAAVTIQADRLDEAKAQLLALDAFWRRHFADDRGGFKAAFNQFETLDAFEEQLEQHLRQLLRARLPSPAAGSEPADTKIAWHQGSPFRGLQVFEAVHEKIFFGRARVEQAVIEAVVRQASIGTAFVLVLGASGSGKSSLVRAGVVPQLMAPGVVTGIEFWRSCIFKPSEATGDLVNALAEALIGQANALPELPATGIDLSDMIAQLRAAAVLPIKMGLRQAALAIPRPAGAPVPEARLVLVIDQLEELFTLSEITAEQRANFVALMVALAKSGVVWVLATLRSDLYHRCAELSELVDLASGEGQYHLTPPRPAELDQMIRLPAAAAGIGFEIHPETGIALNAVLLEAAARDPAALPLLEFTLDELYRQDIETRHGSQLTYESYTGLDGLEGAIAARADAVCRGLPPSQAAALPGLLSGLVTVAEDSDLATARVVPRADLATTPVRTALLDILVRERLLVADKDRTGPVIRLTHEALLSHWPLLKALVDRDRDFLRVRARLQADRARWQAEGHSQDLLLPAGKRLEEAKEVLKARRDEIDAATVGFIEGSIERDRQLRQRALRRTIVIVAILGVVGESVLWAMVRGLPLGVLTLRWTYLLGKDVPLPELVEIREGSFRMGSESKGNPGERPVHQFTFSQPFHLGRSELTFREWDACVANGACNRPDDQGWGRGTQPVINISWKDAQDYVRWLSRKTGNNCRLPSEAEWEYAARAGTTTEYALPAPDGSNDIQGKGLANCGNCGSDWDNKRPAPAGSFEPNTWGLHDMHGNVWEWIEDCQHESYSGSPVEGAAWRGENGGDCSFRMLRGGDWVSDHVSARSAYRAWDYRTEWDSNIGFHVVCSSAFSDLHHE